MVCRLKLWGTHESRGSHRAWCHPATLSRSPSPGPTTATTIFSSLALYYCACSLEVTVTSLHPPRLCRIAVFSIKPTFLSVVLLISIAPRVLQSLAILLARHRCPEEGCQGTRWRPARAHKQARILPQPRKAGRLEFDFRTVMLPNQTQRAVRCRG